MSLSEKSDQLSAVSDQPVAYGFRIVGDCRSDRRLVDWPAALAGYAACDHRAQVEREAYLSAFMFGDVFRQRDNGYRVDVKGYSGPCGGAWLWFDIDSAGIVQIALDGARRLCAGLADRYAIDGDELLIFFSGSKGFHVGLPLAVCGSPGPSINFHQICRRLAESLADRLGVTIDTGVYDRVRAFRAPNSRHPKTGLHKRRLSMDELLGLRLEAIQAMAQTPEPFDVPTGAAVNGTGVADWQAATEAIAEHQQDSRHRKVDGAHLNRQTLAFIRDGATTGDRHRLLYSAAANLCEFGCPASLAHALLTEAGLDSGLTPSDTRRQITCGMEGGTE